MKQLLTFRMICCESLRLLGNVLAGAQVKSELIESLGEAERDALTINHRLSFPEQALEWDIDHFSQFYILPAVSAIGEFVFNQAESGKIKCAQLNLVHQDFERVSSKELGLSLVLARLSDESSETVCVSISMKYKAEVLTGIQKVFGVEAA